VRLRIQARQAVCTAAKHRRCVTHGTLCEPPSPSRTNVHVQQRFWTTDTDRHNLTVLPLQSEVKIKTLKVTVKKVNLCSIILWAPQCAQVQITQFYLQITPFTIHKHSPDGVATDCGDRHPIAAYYSFIEPKRMKGWVSLVVWPIADGLPT